MKTHTLAALRWPVLAMTLVLVVSNIAVMYAINDWLTWGAFTYPLVFLVTDLTNRAWGAAAARKVALMGFALAVVLSVYLATPQIALASGAAFLTAQLLDIAAFNRLRAQSWWKAPLIGSLIASVIDTGIFFYIAFYGSDMNWLMLAVGDLSMKWLMAGVLLLPYKALLPRATAIAARLTATPAA
ncbi:MAG: queuosine precursor transporter [Burkholderiaceae bacterium]|jgi:queuosine precursor transporter|nr:queuosine precursor transporter [Burkholderiaceae bacterium]